MKKRFIFGTIAIFFARLHYRYEVRPYAERHGHPRSLVRGASIGAHGRLFDGAWPEDTENG